MKFIIFNCLFLLFINCHRIEINPQHEIKIIGHGGAGLQSVRNQKPHNTLESISKALDFYKADGVEIDIQISADNTLWLYHDETLNSLTNCSGCLLNLSNVELTGCKYRNEFFVNDFNNPYNLVSLSDVIQYLNERFEFPYLFIDVKFPAACLSEQQLNNDLKIEIINQIEKLIEYFDLDYKIYVLSQNISFLNILSERKLSVLILYDGKFNKDMVELLNKINAYGMVLQNINTNKDDIDLLRSEGFKSVLYQLKSRKSIVDAINKLPDYLFTNNIPLTQNSLN